MTKKEYLYGDAFLLPVPKLVIKVRVETLQDRLSTELDKGMMDRDSKLCREIIRAIKFWETINEN